MCNEQQLEQKYNHYDEVVHTVALNVIAERNRCGFYLLYDFIPTNEADMLYYNVAAALAGVNRENLYINMPLLAYLKFKKIHKWKNIKWFGPIAKAKLNDECKTSVCLIMSFIFEQLNLESGIFESINKEYYGGVQD